MNKLWSILLVLMAISINAFAQGTVFHVKLGRFVEPKLTDFNRLKDLGYVFAENLENNEQDIFVGIYNEVETAKQIATQLQRLGYLKPLVVERVLEGQPKVYVIQLGAESPRDDIKWEVYSKVGQLYTLLSEGNVKVATGVYTSATAARAALPTIQQMGFSDAFIKSNEGTFLHKVTNFETNGIKQELIPLAFDESQPLPKQATETYEDGIVTYDIPVKKRGELPEEYEYRTKGIPTFPSIRSNIKRSSAYTLQSLLKQLNTYSGGLDGFYGAGTSTAFEQAIQNNATYQQYLQLQSCTTALHTAEYNPTQRAIQALPTTTNTAIRVLEDANNAIAKAYLAYSLYIQEGPSIRINDLMNKAIKRAFSESKVKNLPKFDYQASYDYQDLGQLILHIFYIHSADNEQYSVPCWLYEQHAKEAWAAYNRLNGAVLLNDCSSVKNWSSIQVLQSIATVLDEKEATFSKQEKEYASVRSQLLVNPIPLSANEQSEITDWNEMLWKNLDYWASKDPLHQRFVTPLKLAYFQSYVLLEDYFMDKGIKATEAKGLALAVLKTYTAGSLARFM